MKKMNKVMIKSLCVSMCLFAVVAIAPAQADILFYEDFEGYTSFPHEVPENDRVNKGIPEITEGAAEYWYAARFENPDDGTIDQDLAIQKFGGGDNMTHTGRFEDDAGLVIRIDTTDYVNITLTFDWRTFLADTGDRFVMGYYVGEPGFDTNRYLDQVGDWGNWVELMRDTKSNTWQSETFDLSALDDLGVVYIAFWLDNGEGDYAKIDNVCVTGDYSPPIPEPASLALFGLGMLAITIRGRRRA